MTKIIKVKDVDNGTYIVDSNNYYDKIKIIDKKNIVRKLIFKSNVKYIENFTGTNLESIEFLHNKNYDFKICSKCFENNENLKEITLRSQNIEIAKDAFLNCTALEKIIFKRVPFAISAGTLIVSANSIGCNINEIYVHDKSICFDKSKYSLIGLYPKFIEYFIEPDFKIIYGNDYEIMEAILSKDKITEYEYNCKDINVSVIKLSDIYIKLNNNPNSISKNDIINIGNNSNVKQIIFDKIISKTINVNDFYRNIKECTIIDSENEFNINFKFENLRKVIIKNGNINNLDNENLYYELNLNQEEYIRSIHKYNNYYVINISNKNCIIINSNYEEFICKDILDFTTIDKQIKSYNAEKRILEILDEDSINKEQLLEIKKLYGIAKSNKLIKKYK